MPSVPDQSIEQDELSTDEIDRIFAPLRQLSKIALAVSGGSDSVCLLLLFKDWHMRSGWPGTCEILTVDHQLRPESADEIASVKDLSERLNYSCASLIWDEDKPAAGIQKAARDARYRLFATHMSSSGAEALVLAHHSDDQVETFLDRLTRGSGVDGLSAMAADEPNGPEGLRLLRPLLEIPKSRLRSILLSRNQVWCEDPSNENKKYKRSRLRQIANLLESEGLNQDRIVTTARQMRRARTALETIVTDLFHDRVEEHPAGPARIAMTVYRKQPEEIRLRLLTLLIARVTATDFSPRLSKIEGLDASILSQRTRRQTIGGAVLDSDVDWLWVWKEPGRNPPKPLIFIKDAGVWDDRFWFDVRILNTGNYTVGDLTLGAMQDAPCRREDVLWPVGWPKDAFSCSPIFWTQNGGVPITSSASLLIGSVSSLGQGISLLRIPFSQGAVGNHRKDLGGERQLWSFRGKEHLINDLD